MTAIKLSPDLALPAAVVTEPIGIFANRGKGKSNAAHKLVEQLYHAGLPTIVLDVKGDWFGIRSSKDGRGGGLPFLILGGEHGDVPLDEGSGRSVAQLLVDLRVPTVVDLSALSKTKARRWVMEFAEALYDHNREPLMLVVDEADVLIPQRLSADLMRLLGAMEDIAKRGRQRGLGICVISQRVADVNKSVTDLLETLLLFAITGTRTRKAVLDWIDDHADTQEARDVIATLSSLPPGECWIWSPGWLRVLKRVQIDRIETFDSHATPEPGKTRTVPRTFADVDLAAVKEAMAEAIDKAKADDPAALRKRIRDLEQQLAAVEPAVVEIPVVSPEDRVVLAGLGGHMVGLNESLTRLIERFEAVMGPRLEKLPAAAKQGAPSQRGISAATPRVRPDDGARLAPSGAATEKGRQGSAETRPDNPAGRLGKAERSIVAVLAQHGDRTKTQVAVLAGYSHKGGGFNNAVSALRTAGLVEGRDILTLTEAGRAAAADVEPLPTGSALVEWWSQRLGQAERLILDLLVQAWPEQLTKQEIADATHYVVTGGGFNNALSRLRSLELIHGRAEIAASDMFADVPR